MEVYMVFTLLALLACPGGKGDSGDSSGGTNNGCSNLPAITDWNGNCPGASCTWSVTADAPMGNVSLAMIQTGDASFECGPGKTLECGVWREDHDAFSVDSSNGCSETKSIDLAIETDFHNQQDNVSTLFDSQEEFNGLTYMFIIDSPDGGQSDCLVSGDMPSYFSADCSNVQ